MSNISFRIYPRGFFGAEGVATTIRKVATPGDIMAVIRTQDTGPKPYKQPGPSNADVDALYTDILETPSKMMLFEWREQLMATALHAFGTQDVKLWVKVQDDSPHCGQHHTHFIEDCLRFAETGKRERVLSIWHNIISDEDYGTMNIASNYLRQSVFRNAKLPELLTSWVAQRGGYDDLLISMNILFGNYDGVY